MLDSTGTPERLRAAFREAKALDLPFLLQLLHFSNSLLDRSLLVQTMTIVQVDEFDAQALQRGLARRPQVSRARVRRERHTLPFEGKLGREKDLLPLARVLLGPFASKVLLATPIGPWQDTVYRASLHCRHRRPLCPKTDGRPGTTCQRS